ncbi:hypothetical protein KFL_010390030 [Klebsormidium nitens]|uniref:Uncharacterized protein n=1 Tax=Klebsormidium nitens TaxID=105231 RepID=A0A1Y1IR48_KLENI|nr:hypothetical protein KFL_010390030 [Klebsormidium nitens]|eukprot:GAQ92522.1 hypothetical protein KFL_010390030 [Klebsormidium nitens]
MKAEELAKRILHAKRGWRLQGSFEPSKRIEALWGMNEQYNYCRGGEFSVTVWAFQQVTRSGSEGSTLEINPPIYQFAIPHELQAARANALATIRLLKRWSDPEELGFARGVHEGWVRDLESHLLRSPLGAVEEQELTRRLVQALIDSGSKLWADGLSCCPYIFDMNWEVCKGRSDLGVVDLVLTNGFGIFMVIEVKHATELPGRNQRVNRHAQLVRVREQALRYTREAFLQRHPDSLVIACTYTNIDGLCFLDLGHSLVLQQAGEVKSIYKGDFVEGFTEGQQGGVWLRKGMSLNTLILEYANLQEDWTIEPVSRNKSRW